MENDYFDYSVNIIKENKGLSFDCTYVDGEVNIKMLY